MPAWLLTAGLVCAFGVWFSWAPLVVQLYQVNAGLSGAALFSLLALTGLSAASLRLTLGFLMRAGAQALVLSASLAVLALTSFGLYQWFSTPVQPFWQLQALALLAGVGGGCFSALVYQPKKAEVSPSSLKAELASALGHLGIVLGLLALPILVLYPLPEQEPSVLLTGSSHFLGRVGAGLPVWLGWAGFFWGLACSLVFILCLPYLWRSHSRFWLDLGQFLAALILGLLLASLGAWCLLPAELGGSGLGLSRELVLVALVVATLAVVRFWPQVSQADDAFQIFNSKHTWVMSLFWAMSAGSFLGLTAAFPLILMYVFAAPEASASPEYPGVFLYAWMLPFTAILMRPIGTWCALRWGGARTTQFCMALLIVAALLAAYWVGAAQSSSYTPPFFLGFLLAFAVLFIASGMAHASLLSSLDKLFPLPQRRSLGIWLSSVSALGVAYIALVMSEQFEQGVPSQALYGFALFYGICFLLNGWLYLRRHAPIYNP